MRNGLVAAAVQFAIKPNAIRENIDKCVFWLEKAVLEYGAELVVFPETITTGFTPGIPVDEFYELIDYIPGALTNEIAAAAKKFKVHIVFPTYERGERPGVVYNSSALIDDRGEILGVYRKTHPFPTERIAAGGWTTPGERAKVTETRLGKIGMIICYDGDFPELSRVLAVQGAEIIVRPSAFLRSYDVWSITNHARAYDNHVYFVAVNSVGADAGNNYYFGNSMIVSPTATKLAQARGGDEIIAAKLDNEPLKYVAQGSRAPMIFDHLEDRNLEAYRDDILRPAKSSFEPARRIPYQK